MELLVRFLIGGTGREGTGGKSGAARPVRGHVGLGRDLAHLMVAAQSASLALSRGTVGLIATTHSAIFAIATQWLAYIFITSAFSAA